MTPERFAEEMQKIADEYDEEDGHVKADDLMCELLESLGYEDGVAIFNRMGKWYA